MNESFQHDGIRFDLYRKASDRCGMTLYILLPRGLGEETEKWCEEVAGDHGTCRSGACTSIVLVRGMDWNNDLTPWPAEGVFKKAKPFEGRAQAFLGALSGELVPWFEKEAGLEGCRRTLAGISLSGLFALWAAHSCDTFDCIAAISGSFWYDSMAEWVETHELNPSVKRVFIALGDREKRSKDPRMARVEECTQRIVERLGKQTEVKYVLEENITHFSPIVPRLERLFLYLQMQHDLQE